MAEYTFFAKFDEYVPLYRGLTQIWVGTGDPLDPGNPDEPAYNSAGILYAMYINDQIQTVGPVSDYPLALEAGFEGDFHDWIAFMIATEEHVINAEKWAIGKINATAQDQYTVGNSAKEQAERSAMWAAGTIEGTGTATNNSKYWAEQSKSYTNGKDLNNQSVEARATDNAEYFKNQAKLWANNGIQGDTPNSTNNSRYWAEQSKSYSDGKSLDDSTTIRGTDNAEYYKEEARLWVGSGETHASATDNAIYYKNQAKLWANNGIQGDAPGATNNSRYWAEQAKSYSDGKSLDDSSTIRGTDNAEYYKNEAKAWAGSTNTHASATDNAKYYSEQSAASAAAAATSELNASASETAAASSASLASTKASESSTSATNSADSAAAALASENAAAASETNAATNASSASVSAADALTSATNAANSASAASLSENNAAQSELNASASAANAATSESNAASSETNAAASEAASKTSENAAASSESNAEAWAVGKRGNTDVSPSDATYHNNAKYYSEQANVNATNAATSASNAFTSETNASTSAVNAAASEANASTYANNSLASSQSSEMWATGGSSGTPSATNNAKYYSEYMDNRITALGNFLSSATTEYANSQGIAIPVFGWSSAPSPVQGEYTWARTTFTWTDGSPSTIVYNVTYTGLDAHIDTISSSQIDALFS